MSRAPALDTVPVLAPAWRRALSLFALAVLVQTAFYFNTAAGMAEIWWRSETFAHGMLVGPIALFMLYERRAEILCISPHPVPAALGALALLVFGWLLADIASVNVVSQLGFVAMLPVLVWALCGGSVVRAAAFPLAYLFFAVPMGEALVAPLQDFTAVFTVHAIRLTGVPVFAEGRYISIPTGNFEVAEACSGIRYLIASLALGCLYAYLSYRSIWRRLAFIALAVVVPVIANGVRAYGIVMIAHLSGMKYATGFDHLIYGWLFFGLVVFLMFAVGRLWQERDPPPPPRVMATAVSATDARRFVMVFVGACAVLALGPLASLRLAQVSVPAVHALQAPVVHGWSDSVPSDWAIRYANADATLNVRYTHGQAQLAYVVAAYAHAQEQSGLISSVNLPYDKPWIQASSAVREVQLGTRTLQVRELRLVNGSHYRRVWFWYDIGAQHTVYPIVGKLLLAWNALRGAPQIGAVHVLSVDEAGGEMQTRETLQSFLQAAWPAIEAAHSP